MNKSKSIYIWEELARVAQGGDSKGDVGDQEVTLPAGQGGKGGCFQLLGTARESLGNDESVQENPTFVHPSWSGWLPCCWATRQPGRQWLQMFRSQQPLSLLTTEEFSSGSVCSHKYFGQDTSSKKCRDSQGSYWTMLENIILHAASASIHRDQYLGSPKLFG